MTRETSDGIQIFRGRGPSVELCQTVTNGCVKVIHNDDVDEICCCTSELCNGASTLQQQQPFTILFFTIFIFATFAYGHF